MTLERAWFFFKLATAPTPPLMKKITRALDDVKAGAGLLNDLLPDPPPPASSSSTPNP